LFTLEWTHPAKREQTRISQTRALTYTECEQTT